MLIAERIQCLAKTDKITRDQFGTLVDKLVKRMLAVSTRFAKIDGPRLIVHTRAVECDTLAVALHRQLLEIGREPFEVLVVRQYCSRLCTEEIIIPNRKQSHEYR